MTCRARESVELHLPYHAPAQFKTPLQASPAKDICMDALSQQLRQRSSLANVPVGDHHPA
jgi:hypothetical protein